MKFKFVLSALLILFGAFAAAAQGDEASLQKPVAADVFTDKEKTFSIGLPREPFDTKMGKDESSTQYKWLLREGVFFVAVTTFKESSFDAKEDFDKHVLQLVEELKNVPSFRTTAQKPLTLGDFHGVEIVRMNREGKTIIMRIFAKGKVMYTLTAAIDKAAEDAETLMIAALDSFKITAAKK